VTKMGQRIQLIVMLPELFYTEGNINNKPKRVVVYHNQWLYGASFLRYIKRLFTALEYARAHHEDWQTDRVADGLGKAIKFANNSDMEYMTNTILNDPDEKDQNKMLADTKSVLDFLKQFDNNNGYIFVELDKDGSFRFDILNGLEDADTIERKSPQEYLDLFYSREEQSKMADAVTDLDGYIVCDCLDELSKLKKSLKKTTKKVNKNDTGKTF